MAENQGPLKQFRLKDKGFTNKEAAVDAKITISSL